MKWLLALLPLSLCTVEPISYSYGMIGLNGIIAHPIPAADLGIGYRRIGAYFAWDLAIGCDLGGPAGLIYFQNSCLYYPNRKQGIYYGTGLTLGATNSHLSSYSILNYHSKQTWTPYLNIPVTVGYQYHTESNKKRFIQMQMTPLYTFTISYGFQF